jgi:hypothetical protein
MGRFVGSKNNLNMLGQLAELAWNQALDPLVRQQGRTLLLYGDLIYKGQTLVMRGFLSATAAYYHCCVLFANVHTGMCSASASHQRPMAARASDSRGIPVMIDLYLFTSSEMPQTNHYSEHSARSGPLLSSPTLPSAHSALWLCPSESDCRASPAEA